MTSPSRFPREVLIAHDPDAGPLRAVRSTLLASSRTALEQRDLRDAYEAHLSPEHRRAIREGTMVTQWLDAELAVAHYRACDALNLDPTTLHEMGDVVGRRIQSTMMGTLVRLAKGGGITPWTALKRFDVFWSRIHQGGSVEVTRSGPNDARVEVIQSPLADIDYWRVAFAGLMQGLGSAFARQAYVTVVPQRARNMAARYDLSWA